jgi:hypothetical protein
MRLTRIFPVAAACAMLLAWSSVASAQTPASPGPLVLEPLGSGFVVAPDVKFTKINGTVETLAGGYAAHVSDKHLLAGGAGYWLANGRQGRGLAYGGGMAGWIFRPDSAVSFTAKGLAGLGWLSDNPVLPVSDLRSDDGRRGRFTNTTPVSLRYRVDRQFFIAEPEVDVQLMVTQRLRVTAGASYRLVDLPRGLDELAQGPSGSISAQFRFGK